MEQNGSDLKIVKNVLTEYIWKVPSTRALLIPTMTAMAISKFLEVKVADLYKDISMVIKNQQSPFKTLSVYAFIYSLSIILVELQFFFICKAGQIGYRLANKNTYTHYLNLDPQQFNSIGKGEIMNTISRKSQAIQDIIDVLTLNFFPTIITVFFVSQKVISSMGLLPVIIVNICIALYVIVTIRITIWRNEMRRKLIIASNKSSDTMIDGLLNYENVYLTNNQDFEMLKYDDKLKKLEIHSTVLSRTLYILNLVQKSIWCVQSIIIISISVYGFLIKKMTVEEFAFYLSITAILIRSLDNLGFMYGKYKQAMINIKFTSNIPSTSRSMGFRTIYSFNRFLELKNIYLSQDGRNIFENLNCLINKGDKIAIIGSNGAGKSTLAKCILKLISYEGCITLDEIDIMDVVNSYYYRIMAYIPQNAVLFDETVMFNIKYGNSKVEDEEIYLLSKELKIHESIMHLKEGYFTKVGEQGKGLSGGERQKIMILRALLQKPQILVMDEPTANLDKESENFILEKITSVKDLTVITIIHNLDLLPLFNRVFKISDKKIISEFSNDS